jgi:outer membrane receptor protein involved in Fe transport
MKILYSQALRNFCVLFTIWFLPFVASSQTATIKGTIMNGKTGESLPFASIKIDKANAATADSLGHYSLLVQPGKVVLSVTQVGYAPYERIVRIGFEENLTVNLELEPKQNELDRVVVSGSRQEKQIAREVMSVTSIKPALIINTNSNTLSDVLNKVPGVSVVDGQAVIRGSTGWSYNVGSRVMVLLDDMPLMGPDVGDVQWDLLPIEAAENIEVIKGPSSVLYGSSATSGTVNVRTGWPTNKPETKVTFFQGVQDNPRNKNSIWWERTTQPFNTGTFFVHRQKFGQFDLVASGNANANRSQIQYNDEFRLRSYVKTRYRFKDIKGLSAGLNASYMFKKAGRYFLWQNADSGALVPFDGSIGFDKYNIYSIDPHITYLQNTYTLSLKFRHYAIIRDGTFGAKDLKRTNDAVAHINSVDLNFQKRFAKYFTSTSGIYASSFNAVGNVYPGDRTGYSGAAYTQIEFDRKRWNLTSGLRYEINALGPISQTQRPLLRFGANYQAASKTFLRVSYGEGFRFPTVVERYVEDNAAGISVYPNPDLKTERGWYTELGIKQGFNIGGFSANADACVFWMEYRNLIELRFGQYERATYYIDSLGIHFVGEDKIGFKAQNRLYTRAAGYEVSLEGEGNIGPVGIRTLCGYTYTYPVDLYADSSLQDPGNYMKALVNNAKFIDSAQVDAMGSLIPYRNRHLIKIDIEFTYKKVSLGYNAQYFSIYEKIDDALYRAIPGLRSFQLAAGHGDWVHNIRVSMKLTPHFTLAFLVNNVANHTYATRPARLDAMRSFNLQMRIAF